MYAGLCSRAYMITHVRLYVHMCICVGTGMSLNVDMYVCAVMYVRMCALMSLERVCLYV